MGQTGLTVRAHSNHVAEIPGLAFSRVTDPEVAMNNAKEVLSRPTLNRGRSKGGLLRPQAKTSPVTHHSALRSPKDFACSIVACALWYVFVPRRP